MYRHSTLAIEPPLPLLVTGIPGVPGYNALPYFQQRYPGQVIGLRQRDNWRLTGPGIEVCDAEDRAGIEQLFDRYRFAAVLDCAGVCALKSCELNPQMAWRVNVEGVSNLLEMCRQRQLRFVHLSIDLVFSGASPLLSGYVENDPTDPVTVYGKTMVAAEKLILAGDPTACILRISLPMGVSFNGHAGAIDWIQSRFKKSKPATLFFDEIRTPTYTDCLNELCETVLASELAGLYHAGGPRRLSLFQIAQIINRVGGYDPKLLRGCPRIDAGPIPPRAGDVSLDSSKLSAALGFDPFDPWPLPDEFMPTHAEWHFERGGFRGSKELLAEALYRNPGKAAQ
jgi:dTDP-4-dehydrorhamnose reductase